MFWIDSIRPPATGAARGAGVLPALARRRIREQAEDLAALASRASASLVGDLDDSLGRSALNRPAAAQVELIPVSCQRPLSTTAQAIAPNPC
jgi:hypothetical protein